MNETKRYGGTPFAIVLSESVTDNHIPKRVQVLKCGSFAHDQYGTFEITPDTLRAIKANFEARARGVDLAIDYAHESDKVAAGWIKDVELAENDQELWLLVDWTPNGQRALSDKEFRYLSADFTFNYIDNELKKSHGPTLYGAGLTNRPVIKGMDPVLALNEQKNQGGFEMDQKDQKIAELEKLVADLKAKLEGDGAIMADLQKKCGDYEAEKKVAAEAKVLAEKESKFALLLSEKKAIPAQKEAYLAGDMTKFMELAKPLHLSEDGHGGAGPEGDDKNKDAQTKIAELAETKMKENKNLSYVEAVQIVLSEKPDLRKAYESKGE